MNSKITCMYTHTSDAVHCDNKNVHYDSYNPNGPKMRQPLTNDVYDSKTKTPQKNGNVYSFFKNLASRFGKSNNTINENVINNSNKIENKKLSSDEIEQILNDKGIKTESLGQFMLDSAAARHCDDPFYGNKGLHVTYQGKKYLVSARTTNCRNMTPAEFKAHFLEFLNGNAKYSDFITNEVESNDVNLGYKLKNPFWAATKGGKMPAVDVLADRGIKITGFDNGNIKFEENGKQGLVKISDPELYTQLCYNNQDQWLLSLFDGQTIDGAIIEK